MRGLASAARRPIAHAPRKPETHARTATVGSALALGLVPAMVSAAMTAVDLATQARLRHAVRWVITAACVSSSSPRPGRSPGGGDQQGQYRQTGTARQPCALVRGLGARHHSGQFHQVRQDLQGANGRGRLRRGTRADRSQARPLPRHRSGVVVVAHQPARACLAAGASEIAFAGYCKPFNPSQREQ